MDASKIESKIERDFSPNQVTGYEYSDETETTITARLKLGWKWKVVPTNEVARHEDGTPWIQPMSTYAPDIKEVLEVGVANPNPYFEGRRGRTATFAEAKAAVDARVAEVLAMPDTDGVNPDENATVYAPDSF